MEQYENKKVLIVGIGKTGFALINFFNTMKCEIKVTDHKPIFDLNKAIKKLKKLRPTPEMTFGEHRDEDFLEADLIVYSSSVDSNLPQLELARSYGKEVYGQFAFAAKLCKRPIVAVCGSYGRTTITNMIGFTLKNEGKSIFVGGASDNPFINFYSLHPTQDVDYVIVELNHLDLHSQNDFKPHVVVFSNIRETQPSKKFRTLQDFYDVKFLPLKNLDESCYLISNFDTLYQFPQLKTSKAKTFWYSRKSFISIGISDQVQGTQFHDKRIHSDIHCHSEFIVSSMRIVGERNRENLLAAITVCKALKISDASIQNTIEKFPGIPHRIEFVMERNGVRFYNDSKSETMQELSATLNSFKDPVILIAGGKDTEIPYEDYFDLIESKVRVLVLVGEAKERMNRSLGDACQTFLVGSFEESILIAYQKSRTGDTILLSPGNSSSDIFRDYEERGNYFKKLVYQL